MRERILHVVEAFTGGIFYFIRDLTNRQVEEYEVYILHGVRPESPTDMKALLDDRVHLIRLESFNGVFGSVLSKNTYKDVRKYYDELKPDIVHLHSSAAGFIGRWALPCRNTKIFYTPHGYSFMKRDIPLLERMGFWSLEWLCARRNAKTIACGEGEYKEAKKLTGNATFVNNGINIDALKSYVRPFESKKNYIVCTVGRIMTQKNPKLFNEIALKLPNQKFVLIGDGELRPCITARNVEITGWLDRCIVLHKEKECDIFILTSLWEGLPIALLEAMFMRKVCIVSNVSGNRDVIRNGENGFVCKDADDYVDVIRKIEEGIIDCERITEAAHQDVVNIYNESVMAKRYDEIYHDSAKKQK